MYVVDGLFNKERERGTEQGKVGKQSVTAIWVQAQSASLVGVSVEAISW